MNQRRLIPVFLLLLLAAMFGVWWSMQSPPAAPEVVDNSPGTSADTKEPEVLSIDPTDTDPENTAAESPNETLPGEAATQPPPEEDVQLHEPDYGPAILRGGAQIKFEIYDALGNRLPLYKFSGSLYRKMGAAWVREDVRIDVDDQVFECLGLGVAHTPATGLEPGTYELIVTSLDWGCTRHEFDVARGEVRTGAIRMPTYRRVVSFTFLHEDGTPVDYLPMRPRVVTRSKPLDEKPLYGPDTVRLRRPPTEPREAPHPFRGGGAGGSGWVEMTRHRGDPPRYRTDNGRWWVEVVAGADNAVHFLLGELWGQSVYSFTDDFTGVTDHTVTLKTVDDFDDRVLDPGKVRTEVEPGDRDISQHPPRTPALEFDPFDESTVRDGWARVVVELTGIRHGRVQVSTDTKQGARSTSGRGDLHWAALPVDDDCWIRVVTPGGQHTEWEQLDISGGGVVAVQRSPGTSLRIDGGALTPTLRAFTHAVSVTLTNGEASATVVLTRDGDAFAGTLLNAEDFQSDRLRVRIRLLGAERFHNTRVYVRQTVSPRNGGFLVSRTRGASPGSVLDIEPPGVSWVETVDTTGGVQAALDVISLKPGGTLTYRAVAAVGGLDEVQGIVMPLKDDELAREVRAITRRLSAEEARPEIYPKDTEAYDLDLHFLDEDDDAGLIELIGESVYDAFETRAQRRWYARHGAWYDVSLEHETDRHGYKSFGPGRLEPGRTYVLYLWSDSQDDLYPDARIVFRTDEDGNADLGAIPLPTYSD